MHPIKIVKNHVRIIYPLNFWKKITLLNAFFFIPFLKTKVLTNDTFI